jgi:hypothetical protein
VTKLTVAKKLSQSASPASAWGRMWMQWRLPVPVDVALCPRGEGVHVHTLEGPALEEDLHRQLLARADAARIAERHDLETQPGRTGGEVARATLAHGHDRLGVLGVRFAGALLDLSPSAPPLQDLRQAVVLEVLVELGGGQLEGARLDGQSGERDAGRGQRDVGSQELPFGAGAGHLVSVPGGVQHPEGVDTIRRHRRQALGEPHAGGGFQLQGCARGDGRGLGEEPEVMSARPDGEAQRQQREAEPEAREITTHHPPPIEGSSPHRRPRPVSVTFSRLRAGPLYGLRGAAHPHDGQNLTAVSSSM